MAGDNAKFILCICVSNGYTNSSMKDSGLRIRVQRELRDRFNEACRAEDRSAAQVLREFMRAYVERHESRRMTPVRAHLCGGLPTIIECRLDEITYLTGKGGVRSVAGESGGYVTGKAGT